jgi:toxin ParE1/3/4
VTSKIIEAYIASDNPAAADRVIDAIEAACQLIADYPGVGRPREDIERGVMSFPVADPKSHAKFR